MRFHFLLCQRYIYFSRFNGLYKRVASTSLWK